MKKTIIKLVFAGTITGMIFYSSCKPKPVIEPSPFPQDVLGSCTVSQELFNGWFASGETSENGLVNPVNSVTFVHNNNCNFYQWSEQMFLWLTSPTSSGIYKSGNTVIESPVFYSVSPPDKDGKRVFIPHDPSKPLQAMGSISQFGPNKLPLVKTKSGELMEVMEYPTEGPPVKLMSLKGELMDMVKTEVMGDSLVFKDKAGKLVSGASFSSKGLNHPEKVLHEVTINGKTLKVNSRNKIVETEEGQATGDALIAQNGSMVYYITMVNDVYAYYASGVYNKSLNGNYFPTTQGALDSILNYAQTQGWPAPPDPNALAMELKTSWVEAINLHDPGSYITIDAIIPTYTKTDSTWTVSGSRKAKLALTGMHIVGSMNHHPEMVWASFEHLENTPNAAYTYIDSLNKIKTVPADTGTRWLLSNNAADVNANTSYMKVKKDIIKMVKGTPGFKPSNTQRTKPFGVSNDGTIPNQEDSSTSASNSEVLSINNAIRKLLVGKDIRKNYFLLGATWTNMGTAPNGESYSATNTTNGVAIGTSQLANSTMETYIQNGTTYNQNGSCFYCHSNSGLAPGDLSHVYSDLLPLKGK